MAPGLSTRVKNQLDAAWKFCLSLSKGDWELDDYPVVIRAQEVDPNYAGTRLKQYRYTASMGFDRRRRHGAGSATGIRKEFCEREGGEGENGDVASSARHTRSDSIRFPATSQRTS